MCLCYVFALFVRMRCSHIRDQETVSKRKPFQSFTLSLNLQRGLGLGLLLGEEGFRFKQPKFRCCEKKFVKMKF